LRPPSDGEWGHRYGPRRNPVTGLEETHHGLDITATAGRTLVTPEPCTLIYYGVVPGWGAHGLVAQLHGESGWEHWLSHTDQLAPGVRIGQEFAEDINIAVMGNTGQSTGLHVHWETRWHGARLNPEGWLAQAAALDPKPLPTRPKWGTKMLTYARRKSDGAVFVIPEGGLFYSYPSMAEYDAARGLVIALNARADERGEPRIAVPPTAAELVAHFTFDQANINRLIQLQGCPGERVR
jgi:hypothetical protein